MSLAQSSTDIANMAVSFMGSGKEIDDLDTERSQEASACRRFYDTVLTTVFRDYDWGFARKVESLALVTDFRPKLYPNMWNYAYRYPADALMVRSVMSGNRLDTLLSAVPWEIQADNSGSLIMTDMASPYVRYTFYNTEVERYPPDFVLAAARLLAAFIAPRLTSGDPLGLGNKNLQLYLQAIGTAQKNTEAESYPDIERDSDMVRAREC